MTKAIYLLNGPNLATARTIRRVVARHRPDGRSVELG